MLTATAILCLAQTPTKFEVRSHDWREGAVVYQVFVDRFVPPTSIAAKRRFIEPPRTLKNWSETPLPGHLIPALGVWSHELEFWGGDLNGVSTKLNYIRSLGADVVYLTPIFSAFTNHGYDTQNYATISPELGTTGDLKNLLHQTHAQHMKLMLDGVFNHMGRTSPLYQSAQKNPRSAPATWFVSDPNRPGGYRGWSGVANLPELRLENPSVRDYLWNGKNSIVRRYLREGVDGWRLDVAYELGPAYLSELTKVAHETEPGSAVVGEIWGYPSGWFPSVDGVFDFFCLDVVKQAMAGKTTGGRAGMELQHAADDAGVENLLRSWLVLDNHDTPRLTALLPDPSQRKLAVAMQFTLPGCPVIYYGSELGMDGSGDPQNRAPMRWDLATQSNPTLFWLKKLSAIRKEHPALRYGDFRALDTDRLIAFTRTTDKLADSVIVVANPTEHEVTEVFPTRIGRLMSWQVLKDTLSNARAQNVQGRLSVTLAPYQTMILTPVMTDANRRIP